MISFNECAGWGVGEVYASRFHEWLRDYRLCILPQRDSPSFTISPGIRFTAYSRQLDQTPGVLFLELSSRSEECSDLLEDDVGVGWEGVCFFSDQDMESQRTSPNVFYYFPILF